MAQIAKQRRQINRYHQLRAALVHRGLSLHRWARDHGYPYTSVVSAARGERHGQHSKSIRAQLEAELL